jgi:hypothetical protein
MRLDLALSTTDPAVAQEQKASGWNVYQVIVPVYTLDEIFEEYVRTPIHFLQD